MNSNPLRICFVSQEYPEETGWGGIGTYTYEIGHGLARAGHHVVVLSRACKYSHYYVEEDGIHVYRILPLLSVSKVPFFWRLNRVWEGYRLAVARALCHIVRKHQIDLIESPELHAEPLLFRLLKHNRPPLVVRLHSANRFPGLARSSSCMSRRIDDWAERLILRLATAITSPSHAVVRDRDPAFSLPSNECIVIPNPVDTDVFRPITARSHDSSHQVLYLGRFDFLKGVDVLLRAVHLVSEAVPEAQFTLVGAGMGKSAMGDVKKIFDSWLPEHIANKVRITKYVPRSHLPDVYAEAAICVVPSRWEPFGYTCAEAMACGKPVVASRIGGLAEMIEDGVSGLLVEPGDPQALAGAIIRLLQDVKLREQMGRAARRRAEEMFSTRVVVPQMAELYCREVDRL